MGRKQESSGFGVVARTGVSLLALGFGSALFGALVVGPSLGKQLGQDSSRESPAASSTRLASAAVDRGESTYVSHAREREQAPAEETRAPEPTHEEHPAPAKTEDVSQFVEGTGADTVVPNDPVQVAADSQEPDRSHDEQSTTEPATVKTITEPAVEPERPRRAEKPVEEPRVRERKHEETPAVTERPRREESRTEPVKRRDDDERNSDKRESRRDRTSDTESRRDRTVAEPESRRDRETTRTRERDRSTESTRERDDREERKSTRSRTSETSRTRVTETKSDETSPKRSETVKITGTKRPELVKTATAPTGPALETPETAADAKLFRVRVGRVQPREDAERLRDEIKDAAGVDAFLVQIGDGYQVQTGAYRRKVNAEKIAAELRSGNFKPRVTEDH